VKTSAHISRSTCKLDKLLARIADLSELETSRLNTLRMIPEVLGNQANGLRSDKRATTARIDVGV
jgi:hypothetical protein